MIVISDHPYETEEEKAAFAELVRVKCLPELRRLKPLAKGPLEIKKIDDGLFSVTESGAH